MQKPQPFVLEKWLIIGILLTIWFAVGRAAFGVLGFGAYVSLPLSVPLLGFIFSTGRSLREYNQQLQGAQFEKLVSWVKVFIIGLFAAGLTFSDGGDSPNSTDSALTVIVGLTKNSLAENIFGVIAWIAAIATVVALVKITNHFNKLRALGQVRSQSAI